MFLNIKADIARLGDGNMSMRTLVRGLLSQGFQAILVYRFFSWCRQHNIPAQPFRFICERFIETTTGISIPAECRIGKGFRIHHFGGVIFHPTVKMGDDCTVFHQVTIGERSGTGRAAKIGNRVMIGAGAKIIGEVSIGDDCKIGANAVVINHLPPGAVAVGNPAQIIDTLRPVA